MSKQTITVIVKEESSESQSTDSTYIPSQTPSSEDYTSVESSSFEGGSSTDYSIACSDITDITESSILSDDCSSVASFTESSSYYTDSEYSQY